jgi:hypothetical protein
MIKAKPFKISQKFRVSVLHETSFFATKKQIRDGVGEHTKFNEAVRNILEQYESCKITNPQVTGFLGYYEGFTVQLDPR